MTKFKTFIIILFLLILLICDVECRHRRYRVHKGSSLAKFHIKTLKAWRRTYPKRHKRRRHYHRSNDIPFNEILNEMDSLMRPRFG
uniref:Uncharacterized protein n=1 Tax=Panagrolaimus sp. PS1159 TaxID=55785 RepID=A0AC35GSH9_9BILA